MITAERRFLEMFKAGWQTRVGVHTTLENGWLPMKALVFPDAGGDPVRSEASGPAVDPRAVAAALFGPLGVL